MDGLLELLETMWWKNKTKDIVSVWCNKSRVYLGQDDTIYSNIKNDDIEHL